MFVCSCPPGEVFPCRIVELRKRCGSRVIFYTVRKSHDLSRVWSGGTLESFPQGRAKYGIKLYVADIFIIGRADFYTLFYLDIEPGMFSASETVYSID